MEQPSKKNITPSNKNFVDKEERYVEIYKLTSQTTKKSYVGQAVSHILNNGKYRKYGMERRFASHVSEAFSTKKNQCAYLNNAIRKYGADDFTLELLELCSVEDSEKTESANILKHNTMFPNGYNLKLGSATVSLSEEGKKRVSNGVYNYFKDKKYDRFKNINFPLDENLNNYIHPLNRHGVQYGWYVYIERKKADFGGVHIPLEISKQRAIEFLQQLQEKYEAKHLDAGNTDEVKCHSFGTTSSEKSEEGSRLIAEPDGKNPKEMVNPQVRT